MSYFSTKYITKHQNFQMLKNSLQSITIFESRNLITDSYWTYPLTKLSPPITRNFLKKFSDNNAWELWIHKYSLISVICPKFVSSSCCILPEKNRLKMNIYTGHLQAYKVNHQLCKVKCNNMIIFMIVIYLNQSN